MVRFVANTVSVFDEDEDFILVGFADEQDEQYREALHFQRAYHFDEQDIALGMDQVYIERGIQSRSAYGGITSVELHPNHVRVELNEKTGRALGSDEFVIEFTISNTEFERLRHGLRAVFHGFEVLLESDATP
jgi:hypothetical protein